MYACSPRDVRRRSGTAMTARASLATELFVSGGGRASSRVGRLRSHASLVLRPAHRKGREPLVRPGDRVARVSLASGSAGPLGGDDFMLEVRVGQGSTLVFNEVASMLVLPGAREGRSWMRIGIVLEEDATLVWIPEPLIAARGCDHVHAIDVTLAASARLLMRDELLLGRQDEPPGNLDQDIGIRRDGRTLFRQQLRCGPRARGATGPAVLGDSKCVGSVLVVDPAWSVHPRAVEMFAPTAAVLPLEGPAVQISALAADTLSLRRLLDRGVALLGEPWAPAAISPPVGLSSEAPTPGPRNVPDCRSGGSRDRVRDDGPLLPRGSGLPALLPHGSGPSGPPAWGHGSGRAVRKPI